jgi:hypothetical protein
VGSPGIDHDAPGSPRQLVRPEGIQVEDISPGHQHIDLVYVAEVVGGGPPTAAGLPVLDGDEPQMQWVDAEGLLARPVTDEVRAWARLALRVVPQRLALRADAP